MSNHWMYRFLTVVLVCAAVLVGWMVAMTAGSEIACGLSGGHSVQRHYTVVCEMPKAPRK